MNIPRILHQTWKDSEVPEVFSEYVASWRSCHPDWEYRLWTDELNREFIAAHYPWFLATYDRYPKPIQRADAVRYFILHKLGGLYVDLDFLCQEMNREFNTVGSKSNDATLAQHVVNAKTELEKAREQVQNVE